MREYQMALAIWDKDADIEKKFYYPPAITKTFKTANETYIVYYWHWEAQPFDMDILKDKRHALISFDDENQFDYDIVCEDSRGCDEEFGSFFGWSLAIGTPYGAVNLEMV